MYVLPSDGIDIIISIPTARLRPLLPHAKMVRGQTGGTRRLRFDTSNGELDISFFRLARTDAAIADFGAYVRDQIQSEINAAGFISEKSTRSTTGGQRHCVRRRCVAADSHRQRRGASICAADRPAHDRVSAMCSRHPGASGYWEFSLIHEFFQRSGAVAGMRAPPHQSGHVRMIPAI